MSSGRVNLLRQESVLVARYFTLFLNDKMSLAATLLQAPVMVLIMKMVGQKDSFTAYMVNMSSQTVLFVLATMAAFMGILMSYREICKEREIIQREVSVGISILATLFSKIIVLVGIALIQALILTAGLFWTVDFPEGQSGVLFPLPVEVYITTLLILVTSICMGLLISAALKNSESAILPVLFVIISQVVFCGVFFDMEGPVSLISTIVVNKWGMCALGATTDLNNRLKWLHLDKPMFDSTIENVMLSWEMMLVLSILCIIFAYLLMRKQFAPKENR